MPVGGRDEDAALVGVGAFVGEAEVINASKMAILLASLTAGTAGFLWLKLLGQPVAGDEDMDTMDFAADEASATMS